MTGSYAYTPHIWPSFLTVVLLVALAIFSWRRRTVPGARVFAVTCLVAVPWAAGSAMEAAAVDAATQIFWIEFQGASQLPAATAFTCFVLEYAWPGRWLTRRNLALLAIPPLLALGLILTNDLHHLMVGGYSVGETVIPVRGLGSWVLTAYAYGLSLLNLVVFAWLFVRSPRQRWPVALMVAGQILGRVLYGLEAGGLLPSGLLLDIPPFAVEFVAYAVALFGFRIFDPIAVARQAVVAQMREGVVVLDAVGRIAGLNPAAERILRLPARRAMGRPARELLPAYTAQLLADPAGAELEIRLSEPGRIPVPDGLEGRPFSGMTTAEARHSRESGGRDGEVGQEVRQYVLEISPLTDWRGLEVGRLLLLLDVTERRRAQAQILEQQRALAMLQERERLARELHDSTGQVLGYVSLQAQAIAQWVREGNMARAEAQLVRMAALAQEAHADVRGSILSLRTEEPESWSLRGALQQYLAAYQETYGIRTELILPPDLAVQNLPPEVSVQLVRVIQEALTNARKHAQARNVQVLFTGEGAPASVVVADDGRGFDLGALPAGGQDHFGLAFMQERMAQVGGSLRVDTAPGAGTRVVLELPHRFTPGRQDARGQ